MGLVDSGKLPKPLTALLKASADGLRLDIFNAILIPPGKCRSGTIRRGEVAKPALLTRLVNRNDATGVQRDVHNDA